MVKVRFDVRISLLLLALSAAILSPAVYAQDAMTDDMVGQSEEAWNVWQAATKAVEREDQKAAAAAFEQLAALKLSDLRVALMADRTGSVRLEQMAAAADAPANLKELVARISAGRKQKALAEDGWHFAAIGRFKYADANFKALADSSPDPVALLELSRQNPNRHAILVKLLANTEVGPSAKRFLEILGEGEDQLRSDPHEIAANILKLGGPPRVANNAASRLKASGEYAVPHLIQFLQDPKRQSLHPAIIKLLPRLGREAMNPLCQALSIDDHVARLAIINALGAIGYRQAVPYLARLAESKDAPPDVQAAARQALATLGRPSGDTAQLFYELADDYYSNIDSLKADPRRKTANVWYVRDNELRVIEVPSEIFNDIMTMRCCEEALRLSPDLTAATALWLAANIQREARLGLDVESDQPDGLANKDGTRPDACPRSLYFARAAGPKYNHMVLSRAFRDKDPGVALGAIAALSDTAGEPALVGADDLKQPLVQMLAFPNRQVRIKAALAIARALPRSAFQGADNVMPVLAEALVQSGRQSALVVDADDAEANKLQAVMRAAGFECASGPNLYAAREAAAKANITSYDVILLASDIARPDLESAITELRRDLPTAATPILVVAKEGQMPRAGKATRLSAGVEVLLADVTELGDPEKIKEQVMSRVQRAAKSLGMTSLSGEIALALALQAAEALRDLGENRSDVLDFSRAVPALITTLSGGSPALRVKAGHALALADSEKAQAALAEAAFNAQHTPEERISAFADLAESGRRNGNLLGSGDLVSKLIEFTMNEKDLVLRAAASKALGALDLPSNKASEIIRGQYRG